VVGACECGDELPGPKKCEDSLTGRGTASFAMRILQHAVS